MSSATTKSAAPTAGVVPSAGGASAPHASTNRAAAQRRTRIEDANAHEEHGAYHDQQKSQDAVAHDAVMQLAKAAAHDEAAHGQLQPPPPASLAEQSSKKRRKISNTSGSVSEGLANATALPATVADEGAAGEEAAAAVTEPTSYDFHNPNLSNLFALSESSTANAAGNGELAKETEQADTSAVMQSEAGDATVDSQNPGDDSETTDGRLLARNGRPLNASKRAAQNRAAQRAFRARRDEYVRQVEEKAKQFDDLAAASAMYKQRYEEARRTVDLLRDYNHALRLAIDATGGRLPTPPLGVEEAVEQLQAAAAAVDAKVAVSALAAPEKRESSDLNSLSAAAAASEPFGTKPDGAAA